MIVEVTVFPSSANFSARLIDGRLKVKLRSEPKNNRANIELIQELSKILGREVRIVWGLSSRKKKLEIPMSEEELRKSLAK